MLAFDDEVEDFRTLFVELADCVLQLAVILQDTSTVDKSLAPNLGAAWVLFLQALLNLLDGCA